MPKKPRINVRGDAKTNYIEQHESEIFADVIDFLKDVQTMITTRFPKYNHDISGYIKSLRVLHEEQNYQELSSKLKEYDTNFKNYVAEANRKDSGHQFSSSSSFYQIESLNQALLKAKLLDDYYHDFVANKESIERKSSEEKRAAEQLKKEQRKVGYKNWMTIEEAIPVDKEVFVRFLENGKKLCDQLDITSGYFTGPIPDYLKSIEQIYHSEDSKSNVNLLVQKFEYLNNAIDKFQEKLEEVLDSHHDQVLDRDYMLSHEFRQLEEDRKELFSTFKTFNENVNDMPDEWKKPEADVDVEMFDEEIKHDDMNQIQEEHDPDVSQQVQEEIKSEITDQTDEKDKFNAMDQVHEEENKPNEMDQGHKEEVLSPQRTLENRIEELRKTLDDSITHQTLTTEQYAQWRALINLRSKGDQLTEQEVSEETVKQTVDSLIEKDKSLLNKIVRAMNNDLPMFHGDTPTLEQGDKLYDFLSETEEEYETIQSWFSDRDTIEEAKEKLQNILERHQADYDNNVREHKEKPNFLNNAIDYWYGRLGKVAGITMETTEQKKTKKDAADKQLAEQLKLEEEKRKEEEEKRKEEQLKAEQLKAEQLKAEQLKAEQLKEEQLKAEQLKATQLKAEQIKADLLKARLLRGKDDNRKEQNHENMNKKDNQEIIDGMNEKHDQSIIDGMNEKHDHLIIDNTKEHKNSDLQKNTATKALQQEELKKIGSKIASSENFTKGLSNFLVSANHASSSFHDSTQWTEFQKALELTSGLANVSRSIYMQSQKTAQRAIELKSRSPFNPKEEANTLKKIMAEKMASSTVPLHKMDKSVAKYVKNFCKKNNIDMQNNSISYENLSMILGKTWSDLKTYAANYENYKLQDHVLPGEQKDKKKTKSLNSDDKHKLRIVENFLNPKNRKLENAENVVKDSKKAKKQINPLIQ